MISEDIKDIGGQYKYGFKDDIEPIYTTGEGLSEEVVRNISKAKNEPEWMLDIRLAAYEKYKTLKMANFGKIPLLSLENLLICRFLHKYYKNRNLLSK